jgi:transcription elongation factor Elf1
MGLDERTFFNEKTEMRPGRFQCPKCHRAGDYSIRWVRRSKKDRLPPGANEEDRAKFDKLRDYLLRLDDEVVCKTCGKKFEIPSQHSLLFLDQLEGLPKDVEEEGSREPGAGNREPEAEAEAKPAIDHSKLPARFTRPSRGWRG